MHHPLTRRSYHWLPTMDQQRAASLGLIEAPSICSMISHMRQGKVDNLARNEPAMLYSI